jgi:Uma2 family endonuclease
MSATISTSYTAEDLLKMPDGDRYELVDGQLVERDMGTKSNWIAGKLFRLIADYAESNGLGWGLPTDNSYQCFPGRPNQVRKPDVSFIRLGRLPNEELPDGHCRITPDLVAEVISPNDFYSDVMRRIFDFMEAGVPLIWVIDPDSRSAIVYRSDGRVSLLDEQDELSGESVLSGFSCRISELFPPKPSTDNSSADAEQNG